MVKRNCQESSSERIISGPFKKHMKLTRRILFPLHRCGNQSLERRSLNQSCALHPEKCTLCLSSRRCPVDISTPNPYEPCLSNISAFNSHEFCHWGKLKKGLCKMSSSSATPMAPKRMITAIIHQKRRSDTTKMELSATTWLASTGTNFYISPWGHIRKKHSVEKR